MKSDLNLGIIQDTNEISGVLTVRFKKHQSLDIFCAKHFRNYDPRLHEAVAIRVYYSKQVQVTLYALDRVRHERMNFPADELPVKKFKAKGIPMEEVLSVIGSFNFTLSTGHYKIDNIRVVNK